MITGGQGLFAPGFHFTATNLLTTNPPKKFASAKIGEANFLQGQDIANVGLGANFPGGRGLMATMLMTTTTLMDDFGVDSYA